MVIDENSKYKIKRDNLLEQLEMIDNVWKEYEEEICHLADRIDERNNEESKDSENDDYGYDDEREDVNDDNYGYYDLMQMIYKTENDCYFDFQAHLAVLFEEFLSKGISFNIKNENLVSEKFNFYEDTDFWKKIMEFQCTDMATTLDGSYTSGIWKSFLGVINRKEFKDEPFNYDAIKKMWLDIYEESGDKRDVSMKFMKLIFSDDISFIQSLEKVEQGKIGTKEIVSKLSIPEDIAKGIPPEDRYTSMLVRKRIYRTLGRTKDNKKHNSSEIGEGIEPREGEMEEIIKETTQVATEKQEEKESKEGQTQSDE